MSAIYEPREPRLSAGAQTGGGAGPCQQMIIRGIFQRGKQNCRHKRTFPSAFLVYNNKSYV